jgi:FkbH-like protein
MRRAKVLAVDFDNTIWDGVMADGAVVHHHDRQQLLKAAKDGGVLLVAVSKNDPANIRWEEMSLKPEDFVLQKIDWNLKVESISGAAKQLDLGIDSFVFIDDSRVELELVRSQLPGVRVLDSTDAFTWRSVARLLQFPSTRDTEEARGRTELYRQQAQRKEALSGAFDYPTMMANLALAIEFRPAATRDLDRLAELMQRTNQFNTTTRRYTSQHLSRLMAGPSHRVYVATLADKYGSLGLVGTAVVERHGDEAIFDSIVMSCRAMGFQVEHALVQLVLDAHPDVKHWVGLFVPTARNAPAADLFASCGFASEGGDRWTLDRDPSASIMPPWFTVDARVAGG